jgi:hypothetical protein
LSGKQTADLTSEISAVLAKLITTAQQPIVTQIKHSRSFILRISPVSRSNLRH